MGGRSTPSAHIDAGQSAVLLKFLGPLRRFAAEILPLRLRDALAGWRFRRQQRSGSVSVEDYWTGHTVHTADEYLTDRHASIEYFQWRCEQYPGYLDLMPVSGHDGLRVLDFGCGPGHDLVGFLEYSRPKELTGVDVSSTALDIARRRVELHAGGPDVTLSQVKAGEAFAPPGTIDYLHSSGVLHHLEDPVGALQLFREALAPGGRIRLMVYNRDSIWRNLYVPYVLQIRRRAIPLDVPLDDAFRMSTDGPNCPIAHSYNFEGISAMAQKAGLQCEKVGVAMSQHERSIWNTYAPLALRDRRTGDGVRHFVSAMNVDEVGRPLSALGEVPGVDLVVQMKHA